ncbi:MAG TPA: hypothetical protein VMX94_06135 [Armatimonadota bacterium]|nr:hypothetical protein [Armatimonadota bacterium]
MIPRRIPATIPATLPASSEPEFPIDALVITPADTTVEAALYLTSPLSGCGGYFAFSVDLGYGRGGSWTEADPQLYGRSDISLSPSTTYNYYAVLTKDGFADWVETGTFETLA